jgi:hypothetical protein
LVITTATTPTTGTGFTLAGAGTIVFINSWVPPVHGFLGFGWEVNSWNGSVTDYKISAPFWFLTPLFGGIASIPLWRAIRRRRRRKMGRCVECGYDLRATPDRCPECGATAVQKVVKPAVNVSNSPTS